MESSARNRFVRPRVRPADPAAAGTWLLEDVIAERLARGETGILWVSGPAGAGKRSALEYLRLVFAGEARLEIDPAEHVVGEASASGHDRPTLRVSSRRRASGSMSALELAPWSRDECIEYLLARHPERCASVIARLGRGARAIDLEGVPLLVAAVLEELAQDETLEGEHQGLRFAIARTLETPERLARARAIALWSLPDPRTTVGPELGELQLWSHWLRQTPVLLVLAAEAITLLLEKQCGDELPSCPVDAELLDAVRPLLAGSLQARTEAARVLERNAIAAQPWAASLVHLEGPEALARVWRTRPLRPRLGGAHLAGLQAARVDFAGLIAPDVRLEGADLDGCDLCEACVPRGRFARASLRAARLNKAAAQGADFADANLEGIEAHEARFDGACFDRANLCGAVLTGANLTGCTLHGARAGGADVSSANLARLDLRGLLSLPERFARALLAQANLEGQSVVAPDFQGAELSRALLSATRFPRGDFRGALLREARLAWIDWEGANLFGADLSGASFQLGSSRSGLVFDAPAGWGTRTGFYTDEMRDLGYKLPEEVRRANLRGADLRKAKVFETDFHLVDLRGALFTPDQELHFRSSGAILGN